MAGKPIPLSRRRYGGWRVIRPATPGEVAGLAGRDAHYLCRCRCGREAIVSGRSLRRGGSTQCEGCQAGARRSAGHRAAVLGLAEANVPQAKIARRLGISRQRVHQIIRSA